MAFVVPTRRDRFEIRESRSTPRGPRSQTLRLPVDRAARELIAEMGRGQKLDPTLRHLLIDMLEGERRGDEAIGSTDTGPSISAWMAVTPEERGRALVDLLLLTDALPSKGRERAPLHYPKLDFRSP